MLTQFTSLSSFCRVTEATESARHIKHFVTLLRKMYFGPMVFQSWDKGPSSTQLAEEVRQFCRQVNLQYAGAEWQRAMFSGVVMRKVAHLVADFATKVGAAAVFLWNFTPRHRRYWTPYELGRTRKSTICCSRCPAGGSFRSKEPAGVSSLRRKVRRAGAGVMRSSCSC